MPVLTLLEPDEMTGRGVYLARTLTPKGHHWYFAVSSDRRTIKTVEVVGTMTPESAQRVLWHLLDRVDPKPALKLVKAEPVQQATPLREASPSLALAYLGAVRPVRPA